MEIRLNKEQLRDKIQACWLGKNIGGTIGGPYEGTTELLDVKGFASIKGEPLPNDDLDLQLVWLEALKAVGPQTLSADILAEYWLAMVTPFWNEYGVGKANFRMGLQPPLSGEYRNDWKDSNGAWIRSEIWACLAPGFPNVAIKYAIMDASVDHGSAEGTYAEMFTAALESIAFVETDLRSAIDTALSYIPESCRVAKCVRFVLEEYDRGTPWQTVRQKIVEGVNDLGWFQAPGNVAFTVLGLMYGEGDFKKSMLITVDCGDDTDCTCATCGSVLGILGGMKALPEDWLEFIGDRIITCCVGASYRRVMPQTCGELTERVLRQIPTVLNAHGVYTEYTDGESTYDREAAFKVLEGCGLQFAKRLPRNFEVTNHASLKAVVEYEKDPDIRPGEEFKVRITFENLFREQMFLKFDVRLPEGWTAAYAKAQQLQYKTRYSTEFTTWEMTLTAGETVAARNDILVFVTADSHPMPLTVPVVLLG